MNNILVVFKGSFPVGAAMAKRLTLYCRGLAEAGDAVEIVIPHASEPANTTKNINASGNVYGVNFRYLSKSPIRSASFIKRRIDDNVGYLRLLFLLVFSAKKYNVLFVVDVRNFYLIPITLAAHLRKIKVVYELNEHPLVWFKPAKYNLTKKIIYPLFDGFILISNGLTTLSKEFLGRSAKTLLVPIIIETKDDDSRSENRENKEGDYILHSGTLTEYQNGIIGMLKAVAIVNEKGHNLSMFYTGNIEKSPDKALIMQLLDTTPSLKDKVKFLGFLSEEDLAYYQKNSVCFIINKEDNLQNKYCFATKTGEYLATGNPVIQTNVGDAQSYFKNGVNSLIVEPGDISGIADAIISLLENPAKRYEVGQEGKKTALSDFNYRTHGIRLSNFFAELTNKKNT